MESPLSEEQIKKINEISKLNPEDQKKVLPEFLSTLNEEQITFLRNQQGRDQGNNCLFCSLVEGKIESYKVYEDDEFLGVLDINPANKGHALIFPKKHKQFLGELNEEEISKLFNIANKLGNKMVEKLKAEGVNVYAASGIGQIVPHISINIIPRFKDDKIMFGWNPRKIEKKELEKISKELKINKLKEKEIKKEKPKKIKLRKFEERIP